MRGERVFELSAYAQASNRWAITLAELAPDRFVLGIGNSWPVIVEDWNGAECAEPFGRTRDTLRFLPTGADPAELVRRLGPAN
jgi:luciferase-like monooxygenase